MAILYNRIRRVRGKEAKWLGVIGGISKHLNPEADPLILRLIFFIVAVASGGFVMLFLYIALAATLQLEEKEETEE